MTYLEAMRDSRVQYAVATGRIEDRNEKEVIKFLENIMQKAKKRSNTPENGYVVINNGYAYFARKIERGIEAAKETDLENVLDLIDQGLLKKTGADRSRGATYYTPEVATLKSMEKLLEATGQRLNDAILEYKERLNSHKGTFDMKESVSHLKRRFSTQQTTINIIRRHAS